jgi:putative transcriptional regulator
MSIEHTAEDIIQLTAEEIRDFKGDVDWDKINATTEEDIERQAHEDGDTTDIDESSITRHRGATYYRELRKRLGDLSHAEFARRLGVDEQMVVAWENSFVAPEGPAEVLLQILEREPEAVARALSARVA